ncbi:MAG: AI-2E family transporter [Bacteroidota bacterium]
MKSFKIKWWYVLGALLTGFLVWYFSNIVAYILISFVLSLMGHPLVRLLDRIRYKRFHFSHVLSSIVTLMLIWTILIGLFYIFVPLITYEAKAVSQVNWSSFFSSFHEPLIRFQNQLMDAGILNQGDSIETMVTQKVSSVLNFSQFSNAFSTIFSFAGSLVVAFFAISFITFFFLKDDKLFRNSLMIVTPISYQTEMNHILISCRKMLSRYFLGLCLDIFLVITLISLGMMFIGVKNFLLVGFIAGIMNVVPYIGPIIGALLGISLGVTDCVNADFNTVVLPLIIRMLLVFLSVNLLDGIVLQPTIYSNSVKAHPLEIFLVIMAAGSLAGVLGMILAIPCYTLLRIVAKEFFSGFRVIKKLTENL